MFRMTKNKSKGCPKPQTLHNKVVILDNPVSLIKYPLSFQKMAYRLEDKNLDDRKLWKNPQKYLDIFFENLSKAVKSEKEIIIMNYNPAIAHLLGVYQENLREDNLKEWIVVTFLHKDEETSQIFYDKDKNLLEEKTFFLRHIEQYPYIKKFIVPACYRMNMQYIEKLVKEISYINLDYQVTFETTKRKLNFVL
jgi:hypothetical protein